VAENAVDGLLLVCLLLLGAALYVLLASAMLGLPAMCLWVLVALVLKRQGCPLRGPYQSWHYGFWRGLLLAYGVVLVTSALGWCDCAWLAFAVPAITCGYCMLRGKGVPSQLYIEF
jgi:hypothetical protein